MIFIFIIILFMMIVINIQITKDIFHPTVLFKGVWLICFIIYAFFKDIWGFSVSIHTLGIFLMGFVFFDLGFIYHKLFINKIRKKNTFSNANQIKGNRIFLLLILSVLLSTILIISIINSVGVSSLFSKDFFVSFRDMQFDGSGTVKKEKLMFEVMKLIGVSSFIFLIREYEKSNIRKITYLLIMIVTFGTMMFSTGRMWLLSIVIQMIIISITYSKKSGKYFNYKTQLKYFKKMSLFFTLFLVFFYVYGKITADKIDASNVFNKIALYTSSPLIAFDLTWQSRANTSNYFGEYLLSPLYNLIDKIFLTDIVQVTDRLPFIFGDNGFATNVYTFYDTQVRDFGIWAIPVVMFCIGVLISYLKYKSETEIQIGFWTAIYAMFIYSLLLSFFNDKFFGFSTATYMSIIIYFIIFKTKIFNSKKYNEGAK